MDNKSLTKFQSDYKSYLKASLNLRRSAKDFIKDSLEKSEGKRIDFNCDKEGESVEIRDAYGDVYILTMIYLDKDGRIQIVPKVGYEVPTACLDSNYLTEIAFAVIAHLSNNQK
jgi:hypothetical protein